MLATQIVGRDQVLVRLEETLAAGRRSARTVQLIGEAGVGKTRLATALLERAQLGGQAVLVGRAQPTDAALALSVFQDAVRADRRSRKDAHAAVDEFQRQLLPELGGVLGEALGERGALFESACAYLRARTVEAGIVLVLEDLHWADGTSLALIGHLANAMRRERLVMLLTYRPDESPPGSPLDVLRRELARHRLGEEIALQPLDRGDATSMLRRLLGCPPHPGAAEAVWRLSAGNPFAIEEVTRHLLETGHLEPGSGRWKGERPPTLPWTVQEMLLERVRRVPEGEQELLRWAAVIGQRLDLRVLAAAAGTSEEDALAALARLNEAGLVREDSSDPTGLRFTFRHALTQEAVSSTLLTAERRRRHARVLKAAEAVYGDAPDAPIEELAGHAIAAGDRVRGFHYSARAARRSLDLRGYAEAETHFRRALENWDPPAGPVARAALLLEYGRLLARVRRDVRAPDVLSEARAAFLAIPDRVAAAQALAAAAGARWNNGVRAGVLEDLRAARAELSHGDPLDAHLEITPVLARALWMAGALREAEEVACEGLSLVPETATSLQRLRQVHLLTTLGSTRWLMGRADEGDATLTDALRLAREHRDDLGEIRACSDLAFWHLNRSAAEARAHTDAGLALARERDFPLGEAWLSTARALSDLKSGQWETAGPMLAAAEACLARIGPDPELRLSVAWAKGEWDLAVEGPGPARSDLEAIASAPTRSATSSS